MKKIKDSLQESENENQNGYSLKTNDEIIAMISEFGNGEMEFHTLDIERLVVENERARALMELFEASKTYHELPNDNGYEYNRGYVKGMNNVINRFKDIF